MYFIQEEVLGQVSVPPMLVPRSEKHYIPSSSMESTSLKRIVAIEDNERELTGCSGNRGQGVKNCPQPLLQGGLQSSLKQSLSGKFTMRIRAAQDAISGMLGYSSQLI